MLVRRRSLAELVGASLAAYCRRRPPPRRRSHIVRRIIREVERRGLSQRPVQASSECRLWAYVVLVLSAGLSLTHYSSTCTLIPLLWQTTIYRCLVTLQKNCLPQFHPSPLYTDPKCQPHFEQPHCHLTPLYLSKNALNIYISIAFC